MNKKLILAIGFATALLSFKAIESSTWTLDNSHARVGFSVSHMMVSDVDGYFKKVQATITSKNADMSDASASMTADVASVNTDDAGRDAHLQKDDFFDADKYPTIDFKSTSFKKSKVPNVYIVKGNLTMHGVTKPVTLSAIGKMGTNAFSKKEIAGFKVTGKVNRKDFGIGSSTPSAIVGEEINIMINAEFVKG